MGFNAAKKLLGSGFTVYGFDLFSKAAERAAAEGVFIACGSDDLAGLADCVLIFVPGPRETEAVIAGDRGLAKGGKRGQVIVNMSTVDPDVNIRMGAVLAGYGMGLVDAPVLGRPSGVGGWAFPVGGEKAHIATVTPVLVALGGSQEKIFHIGPLGDGNKLKLLNNMLFGAINACVAEIMALAFHMGIPQKALLDVAAAANAGTLSGLYKEIGRRITEKQYDDPTFTVDMLIKDNHLCLEMARKLNLPMTVGNAVDSLNRLASLYGLGAQDNAAMWKMVSAAWGKKPE
jgi:3-hydroxyisobutyrate dehydrogenase-like beta-hydroxyacid dehydrogenase